MEQRVAVIMDIFIIVSWKWSCDSSV